MHSSWPLIGLGLKSQHFEEILGRSPDSHCVNFFEVHAENFMGAGGAPHSYLEAVCESYALSIHGTGLSLGSSCGLNQKHLKRFRDLVERYRPSLVSEHLAWCRDSKVYYNDLLPLPLNAEALQVVADNVARAQDMLGRRMLVENPSTYLSFAGSSIEEPDFLLELVKRTGCGLLLDVNNVFVSGSNLGFSAEDYLARIPASVVGEVHLAGHSIMSLSSESDTKLRIDDHGSIVCDEVWHLYRGWLSSSPETTDLHTLVEWDTRIPEFDILLDQASMASGLIEEVAKERALH